MRLIKNSGNDRVVDELRKALTPECSLDIASPLFSLFAYAELRDLLARITHCNLLLPSPDSADLSVTGCAADRPLRNKLQARWLAKQCLEWISTKASVRAAPGILPQSTFVAHHTGHCLTHVRQDGRAWIARVALTLDPNSALGGVAGAVSAATVAARADRSRARTSPTRTNRPGTLPAHGTRADDPSRST